MKPPSVSGTEGYAENAAKLASAWQRLSFADKPSGILKLVPATRSRVLDIGAGIGTDAAALAAMGHHVVAVEPVDALREAGRACHSSASIKWVADGLPDLLQIPGAPDFDLVTLFAVWMHLDAIQRGAAMRRIAQLIRSGGRLILSLRHGPVPPGRRMFSVPADETIALGRAHALVPILKLESESVQPANRDAGVTWTFLAFERP